MSSRPGPIAQQRARNARLEAQARRLAARDEAALPSNNGRELPVVMLPANTRDTEPMPSATRAQFLDRLVETIQAVFEHPVRDNSQPMSAQEDAARADARDSSGVSQTVRRMAPVQSPDTMRPLSESAQSIVASAALLGAGCATCRGECCTAGGTHAFLGEDSLVRVRAQFHEDGQSISAAALLHEYAEHVPEKHYRGSCVYHTLQGCALPRGLRSNLCNRYVCGGLTQLTRALDASGGQEAYVAAADSVHLRRVALITPSRTRVLSLKDSGRDLPHDERSGSSDGG